MSVWIMAIQDLLVGILSGLYKISNPQSGRVLIKKFQGKEVLSENSKRFHVNQMENSKFLNEITYQVHEVGKV